MNKHTTTQGNRRSPRLWALALVAGSAFFVTACEKTPVSTSRTDNREISVDLLFEKDGVKVYRFMDGGRAIYYTDARGRTEWTDGGKVKVKHSVETER